MGRRRVPQGRPYKAFTRRDQAQLLRYQGYSLDEVAEIMGIKRSTAERYMQKLSWGSDEVKIPRLVQEEDNEPDIEDMVRYRDKTGIVRWAMPDPKTGKINKRRPKRRYLDAGTSRDTRKNYGRHTP